jgi:hypothetical protein
MEGELLSVSREQAENYFKNLSEKAKMQAFYMLLSTEENLKFVEKQIREFDKLYKF